MNCHFSPNNHARSLFREKVEDYKNLIKQGKKLCFVWGKEKPMLGYDKELKQHYFNFSDNSDNCVGPYVQKNYWRGWYDEFFYWTPDYPLLPVKQAHAIKKFIELANHEKFFMRDQFTVNGYSPEFSGYLPERIVKLILYPKWNNNIFCNGKTASFTYSMRDDWFFKSNLDLTRKFVSITNSYFKRIDPEGPRTFIRPYQSKRYYL